MDKMSKQQQSKPESGTNTEDEAELDKVDSWQSFQQHVDALVASERNHLKTGSINDRRQNIFENVRQLQRDTNFSEFAMVSQVNKIDGHLAESEARLDQLTRFGNELVTNIRVANERRELGRRRFEDAKRAEMKRRLNKENHDSMVKFEDIKARWTELNEINEPMLLWDQIEQQKKRINEIMQRKDKMIEACQQQILRKNASYESDRQRQSTDLCSLVERVDNQVEALKDAYRQHLEQLRIAIEEERQSFSDTAAKKWQSFFDALNANFEEKMRLVRARDETYAVQAELLQDSQVEVTNQARIRLEKECERLELELRRTRDNVLMNSEKLDYNYQVLQRRNDESTTITNQQKKRISRLHETLAVTRRKYKEVYHSGRARILKLTAEIKEMYGSLKVVEAKAIHTRNINREKFNRVWNINYDEITSLLARIYDIDRLLHEQQLVIPWTKPAIHVENMHKPMAKPPVNPMDEIERRFGKLPRVYEGSFLTYGSDLPEPRGPLLKLPPEAAQLMRNLLVKLADRGCFLIEEQLLEILVPYTIREQTIARIDNIFHALRITNLDHIYELTRIFKPFAYCPNCQPTGLSPTKCAEVFLKTKLQPHELTLAKLAGRDDPTKHKRERPPQNEIVEKDRGPCSNHYLVMEPALVLHAMHRYTTQNFKKKYGSPLEISLMTELIPFTDKQISDFWRQFADMFPASKTHLWKTLEHGLNHYVEVLKMRVQYDGEVVFLRRQNDELRHLLQKCRA